MCFFFFFIKRRPIDKRQLELRVLELEGKIKIIMNNK